MDSCLDAESCSRDVHGGQLTNHADQLDWNVIVPKDLPEGLLIQAVNCLLIVTIKCNKEFRVCSTLCVAFWFVH